MKSIESYIVNEGKGNYDDVIDALEEAITYCYHITNGHKDDIIEAIEQVENKIMKKRAKK